MVTDTRTPARPDQLRPLNRPRQITVLTRDDEPGALIDGDRRLRVVRTQDTWHINDEWWREEISRQYFQIELETGVLATIYHDLIEDTWYAQQY